MVGTKIQLHSAPSKRSRYAAEEDTEITATIRIDPSGKRKPSANINIRRSMNRSMSESTLIKKKVLKLTLHYPAGRSTYIH